jgi:hypothetical protein
MASPLNSPLPSTSIIHHQQQPSSASAGGPTAAFTLPSTSSAVVFEQQLVRSQLENAQQHMVYKSKKIFDLSLENPLARRQLPHPVAP